MENCTSTSVREMSEECFKLLRGIVPKGFEEPMKHVIKANIEYLRAFNSFIEVLIKQLEKLAEEEPKREKLKVE